MAGSSDALETLIAELLGDIRHLNNEVIALKDNVSEVVDDITKQSMERFERGSETLRDRIKDLQEASERSTKMSRECLEAVDVAQVNMIQAVAEEMQHAFSEDKKRYLVDLNSVVDTEKENMVETIHQIVKKSVDKAFSESFNSAKDSVGLLKNDVVKLKSESERLQSTIEEKRSVVANVWKSGSIVILSFGSAIVASLLTYFLFVNH